MRENRLYGSEGGEAKSLPYPYHGPAAACSPIGLRLVRRRLQSWKQRSTLSDVLTPPSFSGCERADSDL
jgi:hypothetical protein